MIIRRHAEHYHFWGDTETGMTLRWGETLEHNPDLAPWPELVDISISNYCSKGCEFCYRDSTTAGESMTVSDYEFVLDSLLSKTWGNVFQVALGGGEPLEHPQFLEILKTTVDRGIVPNFTTNGLGITKKVAHAIKGLVGAIAISTSSLHKVDFEKVKILVENGIKTNLHYVLSDESIDEAIDILKGKFNEVLEGVSGLIFLTYKPKGRADKESCLKKDERLMEFLSLVNQKECTTRIGFDACFVPALLLYTETNPDFVDSCECAFFSVYIDEKMNVKPCSFSDNRFCYNLKDYTFEDIWNEKFCEYRNLITNREVCKNKCKNIHNCRGNCVYFKEINYCE